MHPILIADVPSMDARYWAALAGWSLAFARTMEEARATLAAQRCAAVVIGVYFDDSQMFDLVRAIRADDFQNEVPIVCVRGSPGLHRGDHPHAGKRAEGAGGRCLRRPAALRR